MELYRGPRNDRLHFMSYHTGVGYTESQREFLLWFGKTFPGSKVENYPIPVGHIDIHGNIRNEWYLSDPKHLFAAKLRWSK